MPRSAPLTTKEKNQEIMFGKFLKQKRIAAGFSLADVAKFAGTSYQQICKYEMGANKISLAMALRIARGLRFEPGEFFMLADFDVSACNSDRILINAHKAVNELNREQLIAFIRFQKAIKRGEIK